MTWAKFNNVDAVHALTYKHTGATGYSFSIWSNARFDVLLYTGGGNIKELFPAAGIWTALADIWYLLGFTYDGAKIRGYVNGAEIANIDATGNIDSAAASYNIARVAGRIDGFVGLHKAFEATLTPAQMASIFNQERYLLGV